MGLTQLALVYAVGLFVCMLVLFEAGRRVGKRNLARDPDELAKGIGAAEGAGLARIWLDTIRFNKE